METAIWQRYVEMGDRDRGATDFETALAAADSAECDEEVWEEFDLGEAWSGDTDFLDDDPE